MNLIKKQICAVVIIYYPERQVFLELLQRIINQVDHIVIVANSPMDADILQEFPADKFTLIALSENIGLAAGHNRGIAWARDHSFDYVLLLDQDSLPAENMVAELLQADVKLRSLGRKVAVVGPQYTDLRTKKPAVFVRFERGKIKLVSADNNNYFSCHYLITSGSLIKIDILTTIGLFDESFFIDNVDLEWGLRAINYGYECVGVGSAILYHRLGDTIVKVLGRVIHMHSPLRHYYMFRNRILLYKREYILMSWKISDCWRLLPKLMIHSLYTPPRWQHFRMIMLGIWHGLMNHSGKLLEE
jgi:rhamnosyltransferase